MLNLFGKYKELNLFFKESPSKEYLTEEEKELRKIHFKKLKKKINQVGWIGVILLTTLIGIGIYFNEMVLKAYVIINLGLIVIAKLQDIKEKTSWSLLEHLFRFIAASIFIIILPLVISNLYFLNKSKKETVLEKELKINNVKHKLVINGNLQEFYYNEYGKLHREELKPSVILKIEKQPTLKNEKYYYLGQEMNMRKLSFYHATLSPVTFEEEKERIKKEQLSSKIEEF